MLDSSSLELHCEVLLLAREYVGCVRRQHDLCLEGHVAPQVLELLVIVVVNGELCILLVLVLVCSSFLLLE